MQEDLELDADPFRTIVYACIDGVYEKYDGDVSDFNPDEIFEWGD